ncbi:MAG: DUF6150 family protein [Bacteroidia bacterium]|nr:DUF6150 family protein [Bacteroidia bacterium]
MLTNIRWFILVLGILLPIASSSNGKLFITNRLRKTDPEVYCKLKGAVFIEETRAFADYVIFQESVEGFADMIVYQEKNMLLADRPGIWHFTDNRSLADFTVYIETNKGFADFSVAYTDIRGLTGCRK